jgi:hypothetical protein
MAASSDKDAPRGLDFLMSRNRLNVAISRAQCMAYPVCASQLLDLSASTVEHMRLANALCRIEKLVPAAHAVGIPERAEKLWSEIS